MWTGPPKALGMPNPMSSMRTISTFGAPAGAFTSKRGGGVTLRASSSVIGGYCGSASGSTVRSGWDPAGTATPAGEAIAAASPEAMTSRRMARRFIFATPFA